MVAAYLKARLPLFYVFLSGIGFSLQTLVIKLLAESGFHGSFQCIFFRGLIQFILASLFVYYDEERRAGKGAKLFGDTPFVKLMLFLRSFLGFAGIAFAFLAIELIPIGDATVLVMLSPLLTSILSYFLLGESWRLPEFIGTVVSLVGAVMVVKPPFLFGGSNTESSAFYLGVTYALISAVGAASAYLCVRILGTTAKMPWANVCFSQAIAQMVMSIPCLYIFGQKLRFDITALQFGMLLLGGTIGAWSQILMTIGMQREKSAAATAMRMSDVAFGYLWQVLFTADGLSFLSLGGAALVSSSILIIVVCKESSSTTSANSNSSAGSDGDRGAIELTQTPSALHTSLSLEELYNLEDGFVDSDTEGTDLTHNGKGLGLTSAKAFDYAALKAQLDAQEDEDGEESGWNYPGSTGTAEAHAREEGSVGAGDLDLSLHGEHGGLLNAQHRSHDDAPTQRSFLSKIAAAPLFSSSDGGL